MITMTARDQVVEFNVGGTIFATTHRTLRKYPRNLLLQLYTQELNASGQLANGYDDTDYHVCRDKNGTIFIDRDPELFRYVLNFLRTDNLQLSKNFVDFHLLNQEAAYYKLPEMIKAISVSESRDTVTTSGIELDEDRFVLVELFSGKNPRTRVIGLEEGHPITTSVRGIVANKSLNRTEKSFRIMRMGGILLGMTLWRSSEGDTSLVEKWKIPLTGTCYLENSDMKKAPRRASSVT